MRQIFLNLRFLTLVFVLVIKTPLYAQTHLRYGQAFSVATSVFALPISVAVKADLFRKEGLDLQIVIPIPGGSDKMIEALHQGVVDVTHVATPYLISSALAGSDAIAIIAEFNNPIYTLVAQPEVTSFERLKGQVIGLAEERGNITLSIRKLMEMQGLQRNDISTKIIEGTGARYNCLKRKECAAVPLGQPQDFMALSDGYRALGNSTQSVPALLYTVTAVRKSWAELHKAELIKFVKALSTAIQIIRDPNQRDMVIDVLATNTGASHEIAKQTLNLFFSPERNVLPQKGEMDLLGLTQMIGLMNASGLLNSPLPAPDQFIDPQYLLAAGVLD